MAIKLASKALAFSLAQPVEVNVEVGAGEQRGAKLGRQVVPGVPVDCVGAEPVAPRQCRDAHAAHHGQVNRRLFTVSADRA